MCKLSWRKAKTCQISEVTGGPSYVTIQYFREKKPTDRGVRETEETEERRKSISCLCQWL